MVNGGIHEPAGLFARWMILWRASLVVTCKHTIVIVYGLSKNRQDADERISWLGMEYACEE